MGPEIVLYHPVQLKAGSGSDREFDISTYRAVLPRAWIQLAEDVQ